MSHLHTFGCSITQGFALADTIRPILNDKGEPCTDDEVQKQIDQGTVKWEDIHINQPSQSAWPQQLANYLQCEVTNHARRGACFQQIARQCVVAMDSIKPEDVVIVMWTYLSRLSLQWPARTSVPYCNIVDSQFGWQAVIQGFNKFFGLSPHKDSTPTQDDQIQEYIKQATRQTYLTPMGTFNRYYNSMILQQTVASALESTGARIIHLSVEPDSCLRQLRQAQKELPSTLREPYVIPDPAEWYTVCVDHQSCDVILDPGIPTAPNDMHPSEQHHANFATHVLNKYFTQ